MEEAAKAGGEAIQRGDHRQALDIFNAIAQAQPDDPTALIGCGIAMCEMQFHGVGVALFSYAATLVPDSKEIWCNLGAALRASGHTDMGRDALKKALTLAGEDGIILGNLAGTYINGGNPYPGIDYGQRAVAVQPDNPSNHNNTALCLMEAGRWTDAWPHWENRIMMPGHRRREYPGKRWRGERVQSLVVHGEQGLGDEIMFLAYVDHVRRLVSRRLVLEVAPRLVGMARRAFPYAEVIGKPEEFTGEVEAHIGMGDLPALFNEGVPIKKAGYMRPSPGLHSKWLDRFKGRKVALLAHKGGTQRTHEMVRNPPREAWEPVLAAGYEVLSIQYGKNAKEQAEEIGVEWLQEAGEDIDEQQAAIAAADLLVSVPQTALHIGGSLGKRVLCPLTDKPAWRYGLTGPMPWYQTVELFRKQPGEDWAPVMAKVAEAMRNG